MKKEQNWDEPREYFERNPLLLALVVAVAAICIWQSISLLAEVNPWGTAVAVPGIFFAFQALWLITNPYAIVYEDRFEIKHSFFYSKEVYFLDLKGITDLTGLSFMVIYNDDEKEKLPLSGIRNSHKLSFQNRLREKISKSLENRTF